MFVALAKTLGRFALFLAASAMLTAASLFLMGGYLVTWPIMRKSPRERHLTAAINLAASAMTMMSVMQSSAPQMDGDVNTPTAYEPDGAYSTTTEGEGESA